MKRQFVRWAACAALALCAFGSAGATDLNGEQTFCSIAALRDAAGEGWQDTIEAHGRAVVIDLPAIAVPDVETLPILKVRQVVSSSGETLVSLSVGSPWHEELPPGAGQHSGEWIEGDAIDWAARAEGSPMTAGEVRALLLEQLDAHYGPGMGAQFGSPSLALNSRVYYANKFTGELTDEPFSQTGDYALTLRQHARGIPILTSVPLPETRDRPWLASEASLSLFDADNYALNLAACEEAEVVAEDVPVRALLDVKAMLAALIEAGNLRTVESLALGYAVYADEADEALFWLMPTWICEGEYYESPTAENPFLDEVWANDPSVQGLRPVHAILADAQQLRPIDPLVETMWTGGYPGETPTEASILRWADVGR